MIERKPTACCNALLAWEPLSLIEGPRRTRFGKVPTCTGCWGFKGDYRVEPSAPKAIRDAFNGTSWVLMLEAVKNRPGAPLNFVLDAKGRMVPEGWIEPQTEIEDEGVPF